MGSTRLPGKILEQIAGKPLLDHILGRLESLQNHARVIVATTDKPRDDIVVRHCRERDIECFRGSEDDVLERYYDCARVYRLDHIIRLTADNPFVDVQELDRLIDLHLTGWFDFSCSFESLPVGVGAEIFTFAALEHSFEHGKAPNQREHADEYILDNPEKFRIGKLEVPASKRHPEVRLTVDTGDDLAKAHWIASHTTATWVTTEKAIELCSHFA